MVNSIKSVWRRYNIRYRFVYTSTVEPIYRYFLLFWYYLLWFYTVAVAITCVCVLILVQAWWKETESNHISKDLDFIFLNKQIVNINWIFTDIEICICIHIVWQIYLVWVEKKNTQLQIKQEKIKFLFPISLSFFFFFQISVEYYVFNHYQH